MWRGKETENRLQARNQFKNGNDVKIGHSSRVLDSEPMSSERYLSLQDTSSTGRSGQRSVVQERPFGDNRMWMLMFRGQEPEKGDCCRSRTTVSALAPSHETRSGPLSATERLSKYVRG